MSNSTSFYGKMDEDDQKELQLLPSPLSSSLLDLQLSISLSPISIRPPQDCLDVSGKGSIGVLKWQASEQIRLATIEKAYAERLRELTRREVELAQAEFARARYLWERAREEVERAERMKDRATRQVDSSCNMEITCQSCRRRFQP